MIILSELWSKSLDIFRVLRYCVSLIGGDTRERLYAGAAPAVLPGTGVCGRVGRDRGSPAGTAGDPSKTGAAEAAAAGGCTESAPGRDVPCQLHGRVQTGLGTGTGTGGRRAVLLRG